MDVYSGPAYVHDSRHGSSSTSVNEVELIDANKDHNISKLSHLSHGSNISAASTINLGGKHYPVGSRVGTTGMFVIGDPGTNDPNYTKESISMSTVGSQKQLTKESYPADKGYSYEYWNWTVIRFCTLGMVICAMVCLLAAVIAIVIDRRASCKSPFRWWQGSVMYHVSVPYFNDFDKDGRNIGDLKGVKDKISYINYLGADVVVLSDLLSCSTQVWDPVDSFTEIDSRLGSAGDFQDLVSELVSQDKKVLITISPAFTSTKHKWFTESTRQSASYESPYGNYYFWKEKLSTKDDPAQWEFSIDRDMYYHHQNNSEKAVLNWSHVPVQDSFETELQTWLGRGVDGFVIENIEEMRTDFDITKVSIIHKWRKLLDSFSDNSHKILVVNGQYIEKLESTDSSIANGVLKNVDLVQVPFSMDFTNTTYSLRQDVLTYTKWQRIGGPWIIWKLTGMRSVAANFVTTTMMYTLMLPGNPGISAGQEIGRNPHEEKEKIPAALLWRTGSIYPYHPGSILNETTIANVQAVSITRQHAYSMRDIGYVDEANIEHLAYDFPYIDKETIVLKRRFRKRDAYFYIGNFKNVPVTRDWFKVSAGGQMIADSKAKVTGSLSLDDDFTLQPGQSLVFTVKY